MKLVFVFLTIGVFFALVTVFIVNNFSPFDTAKLAEIVEDNTISATSPEQLDTEVSDLIAKGLIFDYLSNNAYLTLITISASLACFIASIHLFIDKVFFKSLWQNPSVFNALRRGVLVSLSFVVVIYLKFLRVEVITLLLIPASALVLEIIYVSLEKDIIKLIQKVKTQSNKNAKVS